MDSIDFTVTMKTKYLFEFLYVNSYSGFRGIINYSFSAVAIVALCFGYGSTPLSLAALLLLASMYTVIDPMLLLFKAWRQIKLSPAFKKPVTYSFSKEKITLTQGEESQDAGWDMVLLAKEVIGSIYLFTGNNNAVILPKEYYADKVNELKLMIKTACPDTAAKLKTE